MSVRNKKRRERLSEEEIDLVIVPQADNDSEWEEPICVSKAKPASLTISATLAARAAFLARVHRAAGLEEWLLALSESGLNWKKALLVRQNTKCFPGVGVDYCCTFNQPLKGRSLKNLQFVWHIHIPARTKTTGVSAQNPVPRYPG